MGFNPHPSSLTGEPFLAVIWAGKAIMFQSTPVIADGRTLRLSAPLAR